MHHPGPEHNIICADTLAEPFVWISHMVNESLREAQTNSTDPVKPGLEWLK